MRTKEQPRVKWGAIYRFTEEWKDANFLTTPHDLIFNRFEETRKEHIVWITDWEDHANDLHCVKVKIMGIDKQPHPDLQRVREGEAFPFVALNMEK